MFKHIWRNPIWPTEAQHCFQSNFAFLQGTPSLLTCPHEAIISSEKCRSLLIEFKLLSGNSRRTFIRSGGKVSRPFHEKIDSGRAEFGEKKRKMCNRSLSACLYHPIRTRKGRKIFSQAIFPRTATLVRRAADSISAATIQSYRLREVFRALHSNFQFQEKHSSVTN